MLDGICKNPTKFQLLNFHRAGAVGKYPLSGKKSEDVTIENLVLWDSTVDIGAICHDDGSISHNAVPVRKTAKNRTAKPSAHGCSMKGFKSARGFRPSFEKGKAKCRDVDDLGGALFTAKG